MSENIIEHLEELQVYLRNNIQEILICKHEDTEDLYLVNTIFDKDILEELDLEQLKKDIIGIEEIKNTDEGINIFTKYYFHPSLKDTVNDDEELSLEKQISYSNFILDKLLKLKHLPLSVLDSLFNSNHLLVDDKGELQMLGSIIINPKHEELAVQDIFKRIGNILHIIFSGNEVTDGEIDEDIPPDIRKIITNCYNNHYFNYEEVASDFKGSSVYKLMNPESEEGHKVHLIRKSLKTKRRFHSLKKNGLKLAIIAVVLLPFVVFAGGKLVDFAKSKIGDKPDTPVVGQDGNDQNNPDSGNDGQNGQNDNNDVNDNNDQTSGVDNNDNQVIDPNIESDDMVRYYNDTLLELGAKDVLGTLDDSKYYKGSHSVKVSHDEEKPANTLVAVVDLNEDGFSFLKNRNKVDVSMWIRSNRNTDALITLKLIGDYNKVISQASQEVNIPSLMWTLHSLDISTMDGNYIKIYITPQSPGDLWIDSIEVEILK